VTGPLVLKLGGELVDTAADRAHIASAAAALAADRPLVVVHGGGRAIDVAMARQGLTPKKVDGLRITDAATLEVVVSVLKGVANTELVAALVDAGVLAVGLSGVDAGCGRAARSSGHRTSAGVLVDLGFVGDPQEPDASLVELLLVNGYVPVIASLGLDRSPAEPGTSGPAVLNVNADVMACRLAAALGAGDLVIAGATPGVLDADGRTIDELDLAGIDAVIADGTASAGMIAKLLACRDALSDGVSRVRIVDGRALDAAGDLGAAPGTTLVAAETAGARM
jgi:acetylglutamate kinase